MFKRDYCRRGNRGIILTEYLLCLYIFILFITIISSSLVCVDKLINRKDSTISDELSLMQLRRVLLLSYDIEVSEDALTFNYQDRDFILNKVNNNLIIQPGTQIVLMDIEDLFFINDGNNIYISYVKKEEQYERLLCKQ